MKKQLNFTSLMLLVPMVLYLFSFAPPQKVHALGNYPDITTQHNDNQRTGANLNETILNTTNVNKNSFGKLFSKPVDGQIYTQPLYLSQIDIGGKVRNVVFVATMHNTIYCFDADDTTGGPPLWKHTLDPSVLLPDLNIGPTTNGTVSAYYDIEYEIGILSTPVISRENNVIYLVTMTADPLNRDDKSMNTYKHRLYAFNLTTGDIIKGPKDITATVQGIGNGDPTVTLNSMIQLQRTALTLANGRVYFGFGSVGDNGTYHGWVLGYNQSSLEQEVVYTTSPKGLWGGVWQSGQGITVDSSGDLYFLSGNLSPNTNVLEVNKGDSVIKLSKSAPTTVLDWFTPYNYKELDQHDTDLGSSGAMIIPGTNLIICGSKEGKLYLMDTMHLGRFQAKDDSQIVQSIKISNGNIHGAPIYWDGPMGKQIYVWAEGDYLKAFNFNGSKIGLTPNTQSAIKLPSGTMPGGFLSISANGKSPGTGILWSSTPFNEDANHKTVDGIVRAYDASDLKHELWNSKQNEARDGLGKFSKFTPPTVVNGKVYMATFSMELVVYGLLNGGSTPTPTPSPGPSTGNLAKGALVTASTTQGVNNPERAVDGVGNTRWSSLYSDQQWINIDLGTTKSVNKVILKWETAYGKSYNIQTSVNGSSWVTVSSTLTGDGGEDQISFTPTNARYVRMQGIKRGTTYGYSLYEFEVYGDSTQNPSPTPTLSPTPTPGPSGGNLAIGATVTASTTQGVNIPDRAIDGSNSTRWSSLYSDQQWINVDLGATKSVNKVILRWEVAYGKLYNIQTSVDGSSWVNVSSTVTGDGGEDQISFTQMNARYVRMMGIKRGTTFGYSLYEFEVYGDGTQTPSPTPGPSPIPTSSKYEAENASLVIAAIATDHANYSGTGFVDKYVTLNKGASTTFTINSTAAGNSNVNLRYSNGTGIPRTLSIYVNGVKIKQTTLSATANWDTWSDQMEVLSLLAGSNKIAYIYDDGDTANVNLDYITVSGGVNVTNNSVSDAVYMPVPNFGNSLNPVKAAAALERIDRIIIPQQNNANDQMGSSGVTKEVTKDGQSVAIVSMDRETFRNAFNADSKQHTATLEIDGKDPVIIIYLPADVLMDEINKQSDEMVNIKYDGISYKLPLALFNKLSNESIVSVTISKISGVENEAIKAAAEKIGAKQLLSNPVEFIVSVDGKEITDFQGNYVDRTITIDGEVNPDKVTAVWVDNDHNLRFIPSTIAAQNGKTEITIHSPHNSVYSVIQSENTFSDLQGHWAKKDIESIANKALVNGISEHIFAPDKRITRAEFISILTRSLGLADAKLEYTFADVNKLDWFAEAVGAAIKAKLVNMDGEANFRPNDLITREEMVLMLANALEFAGKQIQMDMAILNKFTDHEEIAKNVQAAAAKTLTLNIIQGKSSDTFAPKENATRAETVAIIKRMLEVLKFI